jgi:hypothetical protein
VSSDILRRAAARMRDRAEAATPGPWHQSIACSGTRVSGCSEVVPIIADSDAEHIASWHPAVALAVADWLEATALTWTHLERNGVHLVRINALAVATAYLGEPQCP